MILERERVTQRLAAAAVKPVTLLCAPAGYGKSVALDGYLRTLGAPALRLDVRRSHGSLTRFARALAASFEPVLPRMAQSLAIAHERALQSVSPAEVLSAWLAEHLDGDRRVIVIDDLHHAEGDRDVAAFLAGAIERTRGRVRWILAMRSSADLPVATWLARSDVDLPIDGATLRLTLEDGEKIAEAVAPRVPAHVVEALHELTGGAPSAFAFGLQTIGQEPHAAERLLTAGGDPFDRFAEDVFDRFTTTERKLLIDTAAFPEVDETLLGSADGSSPWLAAIARRAPQIFELRDGRRHYHGLFLESLRGRLGVLGSEAARDASTRAALALERAGRVGEALAYFIRDRNDAELVRTIETHGFAFLEAGLGESIHEAINALDPLVQMTSAVVLAIKAMSESTTGRFDTAESWFQLALDRAEEPLRASIAYQYGSHLLRFFRREAAGIFEGLVADPTVSDRVRAYASSALGPAYVFEHRIEDGTRTTDDALAIASRLGEPHLTAKSHHQAAYVALYACDPERAKRLARASLAIATEHGFFDVAASALSVLYNVASDIDDDPAESIRLLEDVGDCAAKSGKLITQVTSLAAVLEIEIERGNEEIATRIDEKLRALDVTFAGRTISESLLPAQALRATWSGDFTGAYRVLAKSAEQQWSPDRKALRHAEIAFYAAAARLDRESEDAVRTAIELLEGIERIDLRVQRARLFVALAATVLGKTESAAAMLARFDETSATSSARLLALRRTAGAMHARYRGARNHNELLTHLAELRDHGFAGLARTLAVLPLDDNAARRVARLSVEERATVLRWADGDAADAAEHVAAIARKLGCDDGQPVLRAVAWHRPAFENPAAAFRGE